MKFTKGNILRLILFTLVLQTIVYFGFNSAYFSYKDLNELPAFYSENVYQYRFLGVEMLKKFNNLFIPILEQLRGNPHIEKSMQSLGSNFYLSLFTFNLLFCMGCLWILLKILSLSNFRTMSEVQSLILVIIVISLISISSYVITPYDLSSYFYLLVSLYLLMQFFNTAKFSYIIWFSILLVIATCNRETSALSLSLLFAMGLKYYSGNLRELLKNNTVYFIPVLIFLATYFGIRYYMGDAEVVQGTYLSKNIFEFKNILGIIFFLICIYWLLNYNRYKTIQKYFLIFSAPYLIVILIGGILWEIRLFVPILIPMLILGNFEFKKIHG